MANLPLLTLEAAFLAITHVFGGPPWTVITAVAIVAQTFGGIRVESLVLAFPSLLWLAAAQATGNRELFFPYAMHFAAAVAVSAAERRPWAGPIGGGLIVVAFLAIRILQRATVRVLAVELVVAVAILAFVLMARPWSGGRITRDAAIVALASLAAYAGLSL